MKKTHPNIPTGASISSCPVMGSFLPSLTNHRARASIMPAPVEPHISTLSTAVLSLHPMPKIVLPELTTGTVVHSSPSVTSDGLSPEKEDALTVALRRIPMGELEESEDTVEQLTLLRARLAVYEEQLRLDESRASITVDVTTKNIILANQYACAMFSIMHEEFGKRNIKTLIPEGENRNQHDIRINDYVKKWRENLRRPASRIVGGGSNELIALRQRDDGRFENFPITMWVMPLMTSADAGGVPTLFTALATDVSLIRRYQTDLHSYKFISHSVAYSPIIEIDLSGIITKANISASRLFGYAELRGQNVSKLVYDTVHRENHDHYLSHVREAITRGMFNPENSRIVDKKRELVARHADGHPIPIILEVHLLRDLNCGSEHRFVGVFVDTTEFVLRREFKERLRLKVMPPKATFEPKLLSDAVVISLDMVNSTAMVAGKSPQQVFTIVKPMFEKVSELARDYSIEPIKFNGDGAILIASELDNFDELLPLNRATRAVSFAIAFYLWAEVTKYNIRIGISVGEVIAYSIKLSEDRINWEITSADEPIPAADRYQKSACNYDPESTRQVQIAETVFTMVIKSLRSYFRPVEHVPGALKGINCDSATGEHKYVRSYVLNLAKIAQEREVDITDSKIINLEERLKLCKSDIESTVTSLNARREQMRLVREKISSSM